MRSPLPKLHGLKWQGVTALILGAILLACGVVLFVSAHWEQLGPAARFLLVFLMVAVFHIAGGITRGQLPCLSSALHAVGTVSAGAAIALVGQIFNMQEHWPAAVFSGRSPRSVGWFLLRDQAQQTLALLLVPAWILCELGFRMSDHIGARHLLGRLFFMWAQSFTLRSSSVRTALIAGCPGNPLRCERNRRSLSPLS